MKQIEIEPGQVIDDRYTIISHLGQGGMGAVWKATDARTNDSIVVIKMPLDFRDGDILKRFASEARTMRDLAGECLNVLDIQDVGNFKIDQIDQVPYYVTRFQTGGTLADWKVPTDDHGNRLFIKKSFDWARDIAGALDFLHKEGVHHRDIKPANILFNSSGAPLLGDFGIAKSIKKATQSFSGTQNWGTLAYMPPEVLNGQAFVDSSDQYSLATTLYEMIAGRRPYTGETLMAMASSLLKGHQPVNELVPEITDQSSDAMDRALSHEPDQRYGNCVEFVDAFLAGLPDTFKPSEAPTGIVHVGGSSSEGDVIGGGDVIIVDSPPPKGPSSGSLFGDAPKKPIPPKKPPTSSPGKSRSRLPILLGTLAVTVAALTAIVFAVDWGESPDVVAERERTQQQEVEQRAQEIADQTVRENSQREEARREAEREEQAKKLADKEEATRIAEKEAAIKRKEAKELEIALAAAELEKAEMKAKQEKEEARRKLEEANSFNPAEMFDRVSTTIEGVNSAGTIKVIPFEFSNSLESDVRISSVVFSPTKTFDKFFRTEEMNTRVSPGGKKMFLFSFDYGSGKSTTEITINFDKPKRSSVKISITGTGRPVKKQVRVFSNSLDKRKLKELDFGKVSLSNAKPLKFHIEVEGYPNAELVDVRSLDPFITFALETPMPTHDLLVGFDIEVKLAPQAILGNHQAEASFYFESNGKEIPPVKLMVKGDVLK